MTLCKATVPVLMGMARAMGRFGDPNDSALISKIFPPPAPPVVVDQQKADMPVSKTRNFAQFRAIIPRSLSGNMQSQDSQDIPDSA